jgi:GntR family transcriptional repressor for pyruvate dehydrogenase complex
MENNIKSGTLASWVESSIIKDIRDNELKSGAEIQNELELAKKYDVGRNVIREALSSLRMLGIIESRKRRGMVVSEPNVIRGFQKVINPHILSRETILNLLGMRVSLEIGNARIVINNVTDEDIIELKQIVAKESKIKSPKVDIEMEREFHLKIYAISTNKVMLDFMNLIIPVFKFVNENFSDFDRFNKITMERGRIVRHKDLIPYLEARDVEGYQKAMEDHLGAYVDYINQSNKKSKTQKK